MPALQKLKTILGNLSEHERERVARACGTTVTYLTEHIANGHRRASPRLAKALVRELAICGLTLQDVRADIFDGAM